jgi:hypothetical protein
MPVCMSSAAHPACCAGKKAGDEGLREGVMKLRDEGHTVDVRCMGLAISMLATASVDLRHAHCSLM